MSRNYDCILSITALNSCQKEYKRVMDTHHISEVLALVSVDEIYQLHMPNCHDIINYSKFRFKLNLIEILLCLDEYRNMFYAFACK